MEGLPRDALHTFNFTSWAYGRLLYYNFLLPRPIIVRPSGPRPVGRPKARFFGPAQAQPGIKLIGPEPAQHDRRVVPGLKPRHVGWLGLARVSLGPTKHVGRPEYKRHAKAHKLD